MQAKEVVLRTLQQKSLIITALELKRLRGSVVMEFVKCGKCCSTCGADGPGHGPYAYLHYFSDGKVKRKYLPRAMGELMSHSREELEQMLRELNKS